MLDAHAASGCELAQAAGAGMNGSGTCAALGAERLVWCL